MDLNAIRHKAFGPQLLVNRKKSPSNSPKGGKKKILFSDVFKNGPYAYR